MAARHASAFPAAGAVLQPTPNPGARLLGSAATNSESLLWAVHAGISPQDQREPRYYVSLGDSLSTGVQPIGPEELQFRTDEGYSDQLVALARERLPGLRVVKLGYPGESTSTMLDGSLFAYPQGNQLAEAVGFLRSHRGEVAFVTLDIGFNDFPTRDLPGIAPGLAAVARNLPGILETPPGSRRARHARSSE